ncbi:MAG: NAD(P)/FAD-dependent oxidoreductase [Ignavibacteriaceae bacterium]
MQFDAIVIGSGPNGLSSAIRLAQKKLKVKIFEAKDTIGGGGRTAELTLPGFKHDICSAIHPLAIGSPFLKNLPLDKFGLEWVHPPAAVCQPFDDGTALSISKSIEDSAECFGDDYDAYKKMMEPLVKNWHLIESDLLGPLRIPKHPFAAARFGYYALFPAESFIKRFKNEKIKSFFLGLAAHAVLPLNNILTTAIGLVLAIYAHKYGWPFPKGGTQSLSDAMASYFISLGGEIETNKEIKSLSELPSAKAYLFDVTPKQLLNIAGNSLSKRYISSLKKFKYGPGSFKMDFAMDGAIPWKAEACRKTATVHIGSTAEEIISSEKCAWQGKLSPRPFLIVAQQSLFDNTRAPKDKHTVWAYCHVPKNFSGNAEELIKNQIERFAPGFKKLILAQKVHTPADLENYNPNYIGGDINGGAQTWDQIFTRPSLSFTPYRTSAKGIYICSSSTPPGGGVHGMCGYHAAETVLKDLFE